MFARSTGGTYSAAATAKTYDGLMRTVLAVLIVVIAPMIPWAISSASAQSGQSWGAIHFSQEDRAVGAAWNRPTQEGAIRKAREICQKYGSKCELATIFQTNECGAIADGPDGWAADYASSKSEAQSRALEQCSKEGSNCKLIGVACNNGLGKAWFKKNVGRKESPQADDEGESGRNSLASQLQSELKRLGCLSGSVDGKWGSGSRRALARFASQAGLSLGSKPTQEALDDARSFDSGYCRPVKVTPRRRTPTVRKRVRCSRVRFAYSRGRTCACAGGRVFTGYSCVFRRRR